MASVRDLERVCRRLAGLGWGDLLRRHGLDLGATDLGAELARELRVDRSVAGFDDFCTRGVRGAEPGDPALSLLYHALASPDVHPTADGAPAAPDAYPTLEELDLVENYIYGLRPLDPGALEGAVVGVFAYQYRPAASSAHMAHADLVFSRAGVARVGTEAPAWDPGWRSFRPDHKGRQGVAVTPARYGAFVAAARRPLATDPVMGLRDDKEDRFRTLYYPLHKLFSGDGCIRGATLDVQFLEYHRNEKLRRIHTSGGIAPLPGFDVDALPFVRDSLNGGDLVQLVPAGASVLLVPRPHERLVRTVRQRNSVTRREEIVRFTVPPRRTDPASGRPNRFITSLEITAAGDVRRAPEYVNIRHQVVRQPRGDFAVEDMRDLPEARFQAEIDKGGYEAAHFTDDTCDGCIVVKAAGLPGAGRTLPAYSIVAAPDFFPLADQLEISDWVRRTFQRSDQHFAQGAPWPLCEGRWPANLELPRPDALGDRAFARDDDTVAAVVSPRPRASRISLPDRRKRFVSFLTDAASNVFAPGWDASLATDGQVRFLSSYGLGSPFPEDSKLCAALNSFWPAVAPDASRTFRNALGPTATPLMDDEIGLHPGHPEVVAGRAAASHGWDGEQGPFFEADNTGRRFVNAAAIERSDYVSNALAGRVDPHVTALVDAEEMIRRMEALQRCVAALPPGGDRVVTTGLWLVLAAAVPDWTTRADRATVKMDGAGYAFSFARAARDGALVPGDAARRRYALEARLDCQVSLRELHWRQDGGDWIRVVAA